MNELYITKKAVWTEPTAGDVDAFEALKAEFPSRSARRMTRLGMMLSHVLRQLDVKESSALVYATSYSETCTIEKFLASFPYPSPQAFQTSIHPGGVEQFLIQNKQPISEFFPLAGGKDLLLRALSTACLCQGESIILCGGEERGTWLLDQQISSAANFAWALELSVEQTVDSIGLIRWEGLADVEVTFDLISPFIAALGAAAPFHYAPESAGRLEILWGA